MKKLRRFAWAAPLAAGWILCGWLEATGALELTNPTIERIGADGRVVEIEQAIELPYQDSMREFEAYYRVRGMVEYGRISHPSVRMVADDCVESLAINGNAVDLNWLTSAQRCDWQNGFSIRLDGVLKSGPNHFEVVFKNNGGALGFRIAPDPSPFARWTRLAQLLMALVVSIGVFIRLSLGLSRPEMIAGGAALALGAMFRLDFILTLHPPELHAFSDAAGYMNNAREIAAGTYRFNQLFQGVGLPLVLAWCLKLGSGAFGVFHWLHWLASLATVFLSWRATARLWGERPALWTLVLLSFHFPFISLAGFFMAETLFGFFVSLLYYLMVSWKWPWKPAQGAALGAIFMLGHAIKGLNAFFIPFSFLWAAVWSWKHGARTPKKLARALVKPLGGFMAGLIVVATAQAIFTKAHWGRVALSAPTGGLNIVEGKCPSKVNRDSEGYGWQSPLFNQIGDFTEKTWPRPFWDQGFYWKAGIDCIKNDPFVLVSSIAYVHYLFADNQLWPPNVTYPKLTRQYGMFFTALLFPGILIAFLLLAMKPLETARLPFLMVVSILFCSWALKAEMRYRVPFDPLFLPMAVYGWAWFVERADLSLRKKRSHALIAFALALAAFVTYSLYFS